MVSMFTQMCEDIAQVPSNQIFRTFFCVHVFVYSCGFFFILNVNTQADTHNRTTSHWELYPLIEPFEHAMERAHRATCPLLIPQCFISLDLISKMIQFLL